MKVYIPTMEELEKLQKLGVNVYNYIVIKVIETIIMEDIVYEEGDMFEILDYLGEQPEIIYAICKLYPEKISESIITSKDPELCKKIIDQISRENKTIYKLDDVLMNFDESILLDEGIIKSTIDFIARNILSCPKYRFDYQGPNKLLDSLFACELPISKITPSSSENLMIIDPIYSVKLGIDQKNEKEQKNLFQIMMAIALYIRRYGLDSKMGYEYQGKDIINKPDENVKRLIRCLEYHKQKCQ